MGATLAIDTSAGTAVALMRNGMVVAEINHEHNMSHAESIGSAIAGVLAASGLSAENVISVVVGRGPAPFTGLRVGIAAAMMFAEGAKAQLSGVVSLDAIALTALKANDSISESSPLLITTDARRKEVYYALYSGLSDAGIPIRLEGPAVIRPEALSALLAERGINPITTDAKITASAIAELADALQREGLLEHDVTAMYLRAPDAVEGQFGKKVSG